MIRVAIDKLTRVGSLLQAEEGQSLVEYGLLTVLLVLVCISTISPLAVYLNHALGGMNVFSGMN